MNAQNQLDLSTLKLKDKKNLTVEELVSCIQEITNEKVSVESKKCFLKALSEKGETDEEFAIFIREFRKLSVNPELEDFAPNAIDLCGTGGDKAHSFNISTFVSFMVASAGIPVIKHGNRSISSKCGSADLIEGIGIPLTPSLSMIRKSMEEINYTFLFAPNFHPVFKHIAPVRKALAEENIITVFNLLGPTINPATPANQLLGVYNPGLLKKIGNALTANKVNSGLVVHGLVNDTKVGGVDELTNCGINKVFGIGNLSMPEINNWSPTKWNASEGNFSELQGGDLRENLQIMNSLLEGRAPKSLRTSILINAATAFWIQGKCSSLEEGFEFADSLLIDGAVKQWLVKASDLFS